MRKHYTQPCFEVTELIMEDVLALSNPTGNGENFGGLDDLFGGKSL